jgi:hypothetical protein
MAIKSDDPRLEESRKKLVERAKKIDNRILAVLKNHIALEQFMSEFLEASSLKHDDLTFKEKAKLCKGLNPEEIDPQVWNVLQAINGLRNKIAHTLDQAQIQTKMDELRAAYLASLTLKQAEAERQLDDARIAASACEHCVGYFALAIDAARGTAL